MINLSFAEGLPALLELCRLLLLPQLMSFCGAPQESPSLPRGAFSQARMETVPKANCSSEIFVTTLSAERGCSFSSKTCSSVEKATLKQCWAFKSTARGAAAAQPTLWKTGTAFLPSVQCFQMSKKSLCGKQTPGESLGEQLGGSEADLLV